MSSPKRNLLFSIFVHFTHPYLLRYIEVRVELHGGHFTKFNDLTYTNLQKGIPFRLSGPFLSLSQAGQIYIGHGPVRFYDRKDNCPLFRSGFFSRAILEECFSLLCYWCGIIDKCQLYPVPVINKHPQTHARESKWLEP